MVFEQILLHQSSYSHCGFYIHDMDTFIHHQAILPPSSVSQPGRNSLAFLWEFVHFDVRCVESSQHGDSPCTGVVGNTRRNAQKWKGEEISDSLWFSTLPLRIDPQVTSPTFRYVPLDQRNNEFRLLRLKSQTSRASLQKNHNVFGLGWTIHSKKGHQILGALIP